MATTQITVGDTYQTRNTDFLRQHGVMAGADYVVSNTSGDKVSLSLKFSNGKICPQKITVLKSFFGTNFEEDRATMTNVAYAANAHFFPAVDVTQPLLPSVLKAKK